MKKLVLLRHGEIAGFRDSYVGVTKAHLSKRGIDQAEKLATELVTEHFDTIICSPFARCIETLELLKRPEKISFDERIREIDFGLWEGKNFNSINQHYPDLVKRWAVCDPDFRFPEGEKMADFYARISDFALNMRSLKSQKSLIITHGGVIRHLICKLLNIPFSNYLYFRIDYCRLVLLELYSEGGVMAGLNRRSIDG